MTPQSAHIKALDYDESQQMLTVTFKNGSQYRYASVPPAAAKALQKASSLGTHFHRFIKPHFQGRKI